MSKLRIVPAPTKKRRGRPGKKIKKAAPGKIPRDLASMIRGLYTRVAKRCGVDPSYVSRVARGERQSDKIENALRRDLENIIRSFRK